MNPDLDSKLSAAREPELDRNVAAMEADVLAALAGCINDAGAEAKYLILGELTEDDLEREERRDIFRAMRALSCAGDGVSAVTVRAWAKDNAPGLQGAEIDAVFNAAAPPGLAVLGTYVRRLRARGRLQALRRVVGELSAAANEPRADVDAIAARVQGVVSDMASNRRLVNDVPTEADALPVFLAALEGRVSDRGLIGLDTGFEELNSVTGGLGQSLVIVGGPPSCGKTTFLKQLADQVAEKNEVPVLFFTYEQAADELRIKTLSRLSGENPRLIARGEREDPQRFGRAVAQYQTFGRHIQLVEAGRETTVDRIRLQALAAKSRAGAARVLIVVDYIQLVPAADPLTERAFPSIREKTDFVCSELRRLARDLDSPVVAISSLNRAGYKAEKFEAFKESGGIEYGADVAILLKTVNEQDGFRTIDARIVKNRGGEVGAIPFKFNPAQARFSDGGRFKSEGYLNSLGGSE